MHSALRAPSGTGAARLAARACDITLPAESPAAAAAAACASGACVQAYAVRVQRAMCLGVVR
eukprot:4025669-Pyramimonas_sp.AAC.1